MFLKRLDNKFSTPTLTTLNAQQSHQYLFMKTQAALGQSVRNLIMKYTERKTNRVKGLLDHSSYLIIAGYLSRELTLSLL